MRSKDRNRLARPIETMPDYVVRALSERGLWKAYNLRPPYQRNDYLSWIKRAKRPETRQRRLDQMLSELAMGDVYMKMPWRSS